MFWLNFIVGFTDSNSQVALTRLGSPVRSAPANGRVACVACAKA